MNNKNKKNPFQLSKKGPRSVCEIEWNQQNCALEFDVNEVK